MFKVASIVDNDSVNSLTGFTLSIFFQGCEHKCKDCYSKQTWNWDKGKDTSMEELKHLILHSRCENVSLIGGDPFFPKNREKVIELIEWIKKNTSKLVYVWTGYTKEEVSEWIEPSIIDFLITERFVVSKLNLKILLRGSSNQKIFFRGVEKTDEDLLKITEEL